MTKMKAPCNTCGGTGTVEIDVRSAEEVMRNCRQPGATQNEIDAAAWIERLLAQLPKTAL